VALVISLPFLLMYVADVLTDAPTEIHRQGPITSDTLLGRYAYAGVTLTSTGRDFESRADPFRRELLAHCYRMVGSAGEAEDLVQETMLRAWRAYDRFDDQLASFRTWLYRIATNVCLTALEGARRRPLPSGLGAPGVDPEQSLTPALDIPWLQPIPDRLLSATASGDPATMVSTHGSVRLAFVAAVQYLPARQRAALILRDVLEFSSIETADILATTPAAVNSALQRARARLEELSASEEQVAEPSSAADRALIASYIAAFESADVPAITRLLAREAVLEMPPVPLWFVGAEHYGQFIARVFRLLGPHWRMIPTAANGQPAVGAYNRGPDGLFHAHTLQVFSVSQSAIQRNVVFWLPDLFELFELPLTL
jgi:RNA polymerase sigma-70 factor, ECF subfamily